jgi:hypothetical protein
MTVFLRRRSSSRCRLDAVWSGTNKMSLLKGQARHEGEACGNGLDDF